MDIALTQSSFLQACYDLDLVSVKEMLKDKSFNPSEDEKKYAILIVCQRSYDHANTLLEYDIIDDKIMDRRRKRLDTLDEYEEMESALEKKLKMPNNPHAILKELISYEPVKYEGTVFEARTNDNEALNILCTNGHYKMLDTLLKWRSPVSSIFQYDECPEIRFQWDLYNDKERQNFRILHGHPGKVKSIPIDSIYPCANNNKALLLACQYGHDQIVKRLLSKRFCGGEFSLDPRFHDNEALHVACFYGQQDIVSTLLFWHGNKHSFLENQFIHPSDKDSVALSYAVMGAIQNKIDRTIVVNILYLLGGVEDDDIWKKHTIFNPRNALKDAYYVDKEVSDVEIAGSRAVFTEKTPLISFEDFTMIEGSSLLNFLLDYADQEDEMIQWFSRRMPNWNVMFEKRKNKKVKRAAKSSAKVSQLQIKTIVQKECGF